MKKILTFAISVAISQGAIAQNTAAQNTAAQNTSPLNQTKPGQSSPAQNKPEEILVAATRTKQNTFDSLSSITVFMREDIERLQASTIAELLNRSAGITITRTGGRGAATGISLRGNQTDHTLILVDGIRIGSSTLGSSPLELLDPALIERIEIVRGPKSSLYGSDALGGVINIITRKASGDQPISLKVGVGNNKSTDSAVNLGKVGEHYKINLSASHIDTNGIDNTTAKTIPNDDNDAFRQTNFGLNGEVDITKDLNLGLSYQQTNGESEYDNNCSAVGTFAPVSCSPYSDTYTEAFTVTSDWAINSLWSTQLTGGLSKDESETLADNIDILTTTSGGEFNTQKTNVSWLNHFQFHQNVLLTLGYDYLDEKVHGTTNYDQDERENNAFFTQLQASFGDLSAHIGGRSDDNEQFGSHQTYNVSIGYDISSRVKMMVSYGEAFKAPTFNDLYFPNFGDPTMVPEESDTYELAIRGLTDKVNWSVHAFQNNVTNLIQYNSAIFKNDQLAEATIGGVEVTLGTEFYGWRINSAISILDTKDDASGNDLARRPDQTINIDIDRNFGRWSMGASIFGSGSRYNDAGNTSELSGYGLVSLRSAYSVNEQIQLRIKADNIFDKDYALAQASSFSGLGDYQQPGTEVLFSVVYTPTF